MTPDAASSYILSLYNNILKRAPAPTEFEHWVNLMRGGKPAADIYYAFVASQEYKTKTNISSLFPAGHYYSPVVDPSTVIEYVADERRRELNDIAGIMIPLREMEYFWRRSTHIIAKTPFLETKNDQHRFYYDNNIFPYGDAIGLRAMIADLRPRNIIEIGSGFSSACMLDSVDEFSLDTTFTFIDPNPERLKSLLRPIDSTRKMSIIAENVQHTDISLYKSLGPGDILFIDSTHVLKTGSDVHYELFHILPALNSGVVIHFHDIQFPFEYPDQWIFRDNHSWNEIYALRAFLMYNERFKIQFWGNCLAHLQPDIIRSVFPLFLKNSGGSLWIKKL